MSSQGYLIRSVEALTSLLIINADSARIKQQSNRAKAYLTTRLSNATRHYFSALSDESVLASDANLDLTIALLDKIDAVMAGRTAVGFTNGFDASTRGNLQTSAVLALGRVIDTMDFDQALRMVSWIGDDTTMTEKAPSLPELPSLLDRLAQRCLKADDLQRLMSVFDADIALHNEVHKYSFDTGRRRDFVPPISRDLVDATLEHLLAKTWVLSETDAIEKWGGILSRAFNQRGLGDDEAVDHALERLDNIVVDLERGPILATLNAAAAKLRSATAPTVPKVKAPRATRRAKVGHPQ